MFLFALIFFVSACKKPANSQGDTTQQQKKTDMRNNAAIMPANSPLSESDRRRQEQEEFDRIDQMDESSQEYLEFLGSFKCETFHAVDGKQKCKITFKNQDYLGEGDKCLNGCAALIDQVWSESQKD